MSSTRRSSYHAAEQRTWERRSEDIWQCSRAQTPDATLRRTERSRLSLFWRMEPVLDQYFSAENTNIKWQFNLILQLHSRVLQVTRWYYWQGSGFATHRSRVQVLVWHYHVAAWGRLLAPVCLSSSSIIWYWPWAMMHFGWEGNHRPGRK